MLKNSTATQRPKADQSHRLLGFELPVIWVVGYSFSRVRFTIARNCSLFGKYNSYR